MSDYTPGDPAHDGAVFPDMEEESGDGGVDAVKEVFKVNVGSVPAIINAAEKVMEDLWAGSRT